MKIIALEQESPGATAEDFRQQTRAEAQRVWELYQQGIIRELYFRADRPEAEVHLQTLPLVVAGLIRFELIPLRAYPGFARLFTEQ